MFIGIGIGMAWLPFDDAAGQGGGGGSYTPALKFNDKRNSQYWLFFI